MTLISFSTLVGPGANFSLPHPLAPDEPHNWSCGLHEAAQDTNRRFLRRLLGLDDQLAQVARWRRRKNRKRPDCWSLDGSKMPIPRRRAIFSQFVDVTRVLAFRAAVRANSTDWYCEEELQDVPRVVPRAQHPQRADLKLLKDRS